MSSWGSWGSDGEPVAVPAGGAGLDVEPWGSGDGEVGGVSGVLACRCSGGHVVAR